MALKLSPAEADDLVRRYVAGEGTEQLGAAFGISSRAVTDYLRRAGVKARPKHHGLQRGLDAMSPAELSAKRTAGMKRRWAEATPAERRAMVEPAHTAWRGSRQSDETKQRIIATKNGSESAYEAQLAEWLTERGVSFRQQVPIGLHAADFTIGPVAVEVTTGWARKKDWRPRFARFFDDGWHLYVVWHDTRYPLLPAVTDDLVAWVQVLEATPPERSQHRVVWRSRQVLSCGGGDADYVAGVLKSSTPRGSWPLYNGSRHEA